MIEEFHQALVEGKSFEELRNIIIKFKKTGGTQQEAQFKLEELREKIKNDEEKEDLILDLLDHVVGWCPTQHQI